MQHPTGALLDPRSKREKAKDYQHDILASAVPVVWEEKHDWKFYDRRNQSSSLSCMAQSGVKMLGIENNFVCLSAKPVYQSRTNKGGGMYLQESLAALTKPLACTEEQLPSQFMDETEMNASFETTTEMKASSELYRASAYIPNVPIDIDQIASIIEQGKGVQLMLFFLHEEYWKEIPEIIDTDLKYYDNNAVRHGVCATDYCLFNGEKCLIIEDSAGNETSIKGRGQRILTNSFFKDRCYAAGYLIPKPKTVFVRTLKLGMKGEDVKELQKRLNVIQTGLFWVLTKNAVIKYQKSHGLVPDGIVGKLTLKELNK